MTGNIILKGGGILVRAVGLAVLMGFVHRKQAKVMCKSLDIVIPGGHYLITRDAVRALVDKADSTVLWHPINYAGLRNLEKEIGRAHVWTTVTNAHLVCRLLLAKKQRRQHTKCQHTQYV